LCGGIPADQGGRRAGQIAQVSLGCLTKAGALIAGFRQNPDLPNELVPASGDRADQVAVPAQDRPQRRDVSLQIVFLDDAVGPYPAHQRVLGDYHPACLDERHQDVECAAAELNRLTVSNDFAAIRNRPNPMLAGRSTPPTMPATIRRVCGNSRFFAESWRPCVAAAAFGEFGRSFQSAPKESCDPVRQLHGPVTAKLCVLAICGLHLDFDLGRRAPVLTFYEMPIL
jgi:hypothetical protein